MYHLIGALIITGFAGILSFAMAETGDDLFYLDISTSIECDVEFGRKYSKVVISDFLDDETRSLHLLNSQGEVVQMPVAECSFRESFYICRWGKTLSLVIDLSNTSVSNVTAKTKRFFHGYTKLDLFRPRAGVTCPIN